MRGPFRSALALAFLALAIFMVAPISKPSLWLLDEWGDIRWPIWFWPFIFTAASMGLFRAKRPSSVRWALFAAFWLLGTIAGAAYLTQGWNGFTVMAAAFAYYCGRLNLDIKAEQREQAGRI